MTATKTFLQNSAIFLLIQLAGFFVSGMDIALVPFFSFVLSCLSLFACAVFGERNAFFGAKLFSDRKVIKSVFANFGIIVLVRILVNVVSKIIGVSSFNLATIVDAVSLLGFWVLVVLIISLKNRYSITKKSVLVVAFMVSFAVALVYFAICSFFMSGIAYRIEAMKNLAEYMNLMMVAKYISISGLVANSIIGIMAILCFSFSEKK